MHRLILCQVPLTITYNYVHSIYVTVVIVHHLDMA